MLSTILKNVSTACFITAVSISTSYASTNTIIARVDPADPDSGVRQTQNQKGMQFPSLGSYEEAVLRDIRGLSLVEDNQDSLDPTVLIIGDAYGRFSKRVVEASSPEVQVVVNDLSPHNIRSFGGTYVPQLPAMDQDRIFVDTGDCLTVLNRDTRSKLVSQNGDEETKGKVDVLVCNNVSHFFDGRQTLDLYLLMAKVLKPGGRAYVFYHGKRPEMTMESVLRRNDLSTALLYITGLISDQFKSSHKTHLFPGLIDLKWIHGRVRPLDNILATIANGLVVGNITPPQTHRTLASKVGFSEHHYDWVSFQGIPGMQGMILDEGENGEYVGMRLTRKAQAVTERSDLDPDLVKACDGATDEMKGFVENDLRLLPMFPFVAES